ncbi:hypothetical protein [uncultured Draconibacterium sp.]|uniref:hypothetical protein n=1 Tax=uncultured Draconibacterium sp. TaxID=1573823 RepID=UPI0025F15134|nr:hypothetical protein [uncultured Draconibacterium sp.]
MRIHSFFSDLKTNPFALKNIFVLLSLVLLVTMLIMSKDAGISGDEYFKEEHAEKVFNFYKTGGKDKSAVDTELPLQKYNGQSFDNVIYAFNTIFNIKDVYRSRHLFNALAGFLLILFTGLLAKSLFGWRAGIIAMVFMFLSPKILGHALNNPKDIPFAAGYTISLYFILQFIRELPKPRMKTMLLIVAGIAATISIRIGGLILIPYLGLFTGIYYLSQKDFYSKQGIAGALKTGGLIVLIGLASYLAGLLLWPYGLVNPLKNPIEALTTMTNYDVGLYQLFEGEIQLSRDFPWYYGLKFILISSPLFVFFGFGLFLIQLFLKKETKINYLFFSFLFFAFAFPIAYTIYKNSNLYGGWRHLLWIYSPFVVLAVGGTAFFLNNKQNYLKYATAIVLLALFFGPLKHTIKNHPLQYIYYNQLVGGVKGAYGQYEMDYYYVSLRDGAEWLIENELGQDSVTIATHHAQILLNFFDDVPSAKINYVRYYEKSRNDWDYSIWVNTHISKYELEHEGWPPKGTIYTMDVDGVPVGAVVKRISKDDIKGFTALRKKQIKEARQYFKNFLKLYPNSEEVLSGYAQTMLKSGKFDSAVYYADQSIKLNPRQIDAVVTKAAALNSARKFKEALETSNKIIALKPDYPEGHYMKGYALRYTNKPNEALKEFKIAGALKKNYYEPNIYTAEILINYKKYEDALNVLSEILKFKPNDIKSIALMAQCHFFLNNHDETLRILAAVPEARKYNFNVVKVKIRLALQDNDLKNTGRLLQMARNINSNSELFVLRAMYEQERNNLDLSRQYIDKALELQADNQEALVMASILKPEQTTVQVQQQSEKKETSESIMFKEEEEASNPLDISF